MKKMLCFLIFLTILISCKSSHENCVQGLIDDKGYSYDDACNACDDIENDLDHQ